MAKFEPGQSGNPAGRPPGGKDRRTEYRGLLEPHASGLIERAVQLALAGDTTALKLCLDRLLPPLRPTSAPVQIPATGTLTEQAASITTAAFNGELANDDAKNLMQLLVDAGRIRDLDEVRRQLDELKTLIDGLQKMPQFRELFGK